MRKYFLKFIATMFCFTFLSACVSYHVPTMPASMELKLTIDDVELLGEATGYDWAFGIFPLYVFAPAGSRATSYAYGKATKTAYDQRGADFLLQPKIKTTYYNFVLFDYAEAKAIGEAVRIKKKKQE
jgi:hypothetical protein